MTATAASPAPRSRYDADQPDADRHSPVPPRPAPRASSRGSASMSHREVLAALSGLLLAMFVGMLSATIVSTALPRTVADLGGGEAAYTWVVVASLLAMTVTTPIWGKFADLTSKKGLTQLSLWLFVAGSVLAALAPDMAVLIGARAVQGVAMGGLTALVQVVIATMVAPRDRGRYFGYLGAVFAVATVSGPLIGGLLVDGTWLGEILPGYLNGATWRWCFFAVIPLAVGASALLHKTLRLPETKREVSIDYAGAFLIAAGVSVLLIWASLAGSQFPWASLTTAWMVGLGAVLLAVFVWVESKAVEPIIPMRLFRDRTTSLAIFASVLVGVAMFGSTVFLVQYFQLSRGMSPTRAGLMTLALVGGVMISSIVSGRLISTTGKWKRYLVAGGVLIVVGLLLIGTIHTGVSLFRVGASMAVLGIGMGMVNQNLVLAVQNNAAHADIGAASSLAAFFRTMGGSIGVSVLGAVLGHRVGESVSNGLERMGIAAPEGADGSQIPDINTLPREVRPIFEAAFADGTGRIFMLAVPFAALALVAILLIREVPLRETIEREDELEKLHASSGGEPVLG